MACVRIMVFTQPPRDQREPSSLKLGHESRCIWLRLFQIAHTISAIRGGRKADIIVVAIEHLRQFRVPAATALVRQAGENRNIHTALADRAIKGFQQFFLPVTAMMVVFVLDLNQYNSFIANRLTRDLFVRHSFTYSIKPMLRPADMPFVRTSQPEIIYTFRTILGQPTRITASRIFGTNKRPRTNNRIKTVFILCHLQPAFQVRKIKMSRIVQTKRHGPFMPVPRDISLDRIKSGLLDLAETIFPQFLRTTEIMKGRTINKHILSFDRHTRTVIADTFRMRKLLLRKRQLANKNH